MTPNGLSASGTRLLRICTFLITGDEHPYPREWDGTREFERKESRHLNKMIDAVGIDGVGWYNKY